MELPTNLNNIMDNLSYKEHEWWITMSVEDDISSESLLRIIRSQLPTLFDERELHHELKYQMREIIDTLHTYALQEKSEQGNAPMLILARFNDKDMSRAKKEDISTLLAMHAYSLAKVIETRLSVSNIPDLSLAMHHTALDDIQSMILTVSADEAKLYKGGMVKKEFCIKTTENPYIQPEHNRYYGKMNTTAGQSIRYGNGGQKVERTMQSGLELFLKEQLKTIQSAYSFEMLYVYISQQFAPLIDSINKSVAEEISNAKATIKVISSDTFKNIDIHADFNTIQPEVSALNKVIGLHDVVKALRMHKVSKVFIPQKLKEIGYVTKDAQCYTYPVKGSKQVKSIRPWIFKLAYDSAAKIALLGDVSQQPKITAVMRY